MVDKRGKDTEVFQVVRVLHHSNTPTFDNRLLDLLNHKNILQIQHEELQTNHMEMFDSNYKCVCQEQEIESNLRVHF